MNQYLGDPHDPLNAANLRDTADVFIRKDKSTERVLVTVGRMERWRTSKVYRPSQASLARVNRLLYERYWSTRDLPTATGWLAYSTR